MVAFLIVISSLGYLLLGTVVSAILTVIDDIFADWPLRVYAILFWPVVPAVGILLGVFWPLAKLSEKLASIMKGH